MTASPRRARTDSLFARQAFSIMYVPLILLLLVAFVAMAVDTGRIRLAKAQLQSAADAAARAGATGIPVSISASGARAQAVAVLNPVAETNVQFITGSDAEWGTWDPVSRTFTVITDPAALNAANSIHVYARALTSRGNAVPLWITPHVITFDRKSKGAKISTVSNLQAEATAYVKGFVDNFGFVGIDGIDSNGTKATIYGNVASDGDINLGNGDIRHVGNVDGDARAGIGHKLIQGSGAEVEGWTALLDYSAASYYPPVTVVPGTALAIPNNKKITGGSTAANAISYQGDASNVTITSGYVKIYQTADLTMGNVTFQSPSGNTPSQAARLEIYMVGNHSIDTGNGNSQIDAHVYAPQADYKMRGTQDFYGWLIAKSIVFKGTSTLNYDGTKTKAGSYTIQLVK